MTFAAPGSGLHEWCITDFNEGPAIDCDQGLICDPNYAFCLGMSFCFEYIHQLHHFTIGCYILVPLGSNCTIDDDCEGNYHCINKTCSKLGNNLLIINVDYLVL